MTAKISNLFICPKCDAASSAVSRPEYCPKCRYRFRKPHEKLAKEFTWEKLPHEQYFEIVQQEVDRILDAPLKEMLGDESKNIPEEVTIHRKTKVMRTKQLWLQNLNQFLLDSSVEQVDEIMKLALNLMQLVFSAGDRVKAHSMVSIGRKIGALAENLDGALKNGAILIRYKKK